MQTQVRTSVPGAIVASRPACADAMPDESEVLAKLQEAVNA